MVKITFVRHAESVDNTKRVWGGLKDSNLTNHGMKQAEALGLSFSTVPITAIYTSDLTRALLTAKAIHSAHKPSPTRPNPPPLHTNELLREQYFGVAEGMPFNVKRDPALSMPQHFAKGIFPPIFNRDQRYPGGETRNEVKERAERFLEEVLMPYIRAEDTSKTSAHIVVVSHGLILLELITLIALRGGTKKEKEVRENVRGMENTGWTRIEFGFDQEQQRLTTSDATPEKPFKVKFLNVNVATHLEGLKRQPGGISRMSYDPKQKDIRAFFSR